MYSYIEYPEYKSVPLTETTIGVSEIIEAQTGIYPLIHSSDIFGGGITIRIQDFQVTFSMELLSDIALRSYADVTQHLSYLIIREYQEHQRRSYETQIS